MKKKSLVMWMRKDWELKKESKTWSRPHVFLNCMGIGAVKKDVNFGQKVKITIEEI